LAGPWAVLPAAVILAQVVPKAAPVDLKVIAGMIGGPMARAAKGIVVVHKADPPVILGPMARGAAAIADWTEAVTAATRTKRSN
jgi:hypothetical protein